MSNKLRSKNTKVIESENIKIKPIFPVYLDTMRIKDTIAMLENGISSISSITKDITNEVGKGSGANVGASLYKIELGLNTNIQKTSVNKSNESYEKIHTDASLFYKLLEEFKISERIKEIKNKSDVVIVSEGDIVLFEGKFSGNEIEALLNKIFLLIETMRVFGKVNDEIMSQMKSIENILKNDERISTAGNMICELDDGTELLTMIEQKNLVNQSGNELARGKYKVLGIVFEKINEDDEFSLTRDTMLEIFKPEDIKKLYAGFNENLKGILNIPEIRKNIKGPSFGVIPIGIYL